ATTPNNNGNNGQQQLNQQYQFIGTPTGYHPLQLNNQTDLATLQSMGSHHHHYGTNASANTSHGLMPQTAIIYLQTSPTSGNPSTIQISSNDMNAINQLIAAGGATYATTADLNSLTNGQLTALSAANGQHQLQLQHNPHHNQQQQTQFATSTSSSAILAATSISGTSNQHHHLVQSSQQQQQQQQQQNRNDMTTAVATNGLATIGPDGTLTFLTDPTAAALAAA
ncbi:hypothetical protein BLA29_005483, partial [Euroglyphus maynei]